MELFKDVINAATEIEVAFTHLCSVAESLEIHLEDYLKEKDITIDNVRVIVTASYHGGTESTITIEYPNSNYVELEFKIEDLPTIFKIESFNTSWRNIQPPVDCKDLLTKILPHLKSFGFIFPDKDQV